MRKSKGSQSAVLELRSMLLEKRGAVNFYDDLEQGRVLHRVGDGVLSIGYKAASDSEVLVEVPAFNIQADSRTAEKFIEKLTKLLDQFG